MSQSFYSLEGQHKAVAGLRMRGLKENAADREAVYCLCTRKLRASLAGKSKLAY